MKMKYIQAYYAFGKTKVMNQIYWIKTTLNIQRSCYIKRNQEYFLSGRQFTAWKDYKLISTSHRRGYTSMKSDQSSSAAITLTVLAILDGECTVLANTFWDTRNAVHFNTLSTRSSSEMFWALFMYTFLMFPYTKQSKRTCLQLYQGKMGTHDLPLKVSNEACARWTGTSQV